MGPPAEESRLENDVRLAGAQRFEEPPELHGVVLEIGVLHGDEVAGGLPEPGPERRALPLVLHMAEHPDLRMPRGAAFCDREAPITGAVVHEDHFKGQRLILDVQNLADAGRQGVLLVEAGDDNRELHGCSGLFRSRRLTSWPRSWRVRSFSGASGVGSPAGVARWDPGASAPVYRIEGGERISELGRLFKDPRSARSRARPAGRPRGVV